MSILSQEAKQQFLNDLVTELRKVNMTFFKSSPPKGVADMMKVENQRVIKEVAMKHGLYIPPITGDNENI